MRAPLKLRAQVCVNPYCSRSNQSQKPVTTRLNILGGVEGDSPHPHNYPVRHSHDIHAAFSSSGRRKGQQRLREYPRLVGWSGGEKKKKPRVRNSRQHTRCIYTHVAGCRFHRCCPSSVRPCDGVGRHRSFKRLNTSTPGELGGLSHLCPYLLYPFFSLFLFPFQCLAERVVRVHGSQGCDATPLPLLATSHVNQRGARFNRNLERGRPRPRSRGVGWEGADPARNDYHVSQKTRSRALWRRTPAAREELAIR